VTHPAASVPPQPVEGALAFAQALLSQPTCVRMRPGPRHWDIFAGLCRAAAAKGNIVPDAYHAALAIETGSEWITTDRDYARFPGLRWRHPLD
jgi:predicted nucleic acid-binding protein